MPDGGSVIYNEGAAKAKPIAPKRKAKHKGRPAKRRAEEDLDDHHDEEEDPSPSPTKKGRCAKGTAAGTTRSKVKTAQAVLPDKEEKMIAKLPTGREKRFLDDVFDAICSAGGGFTSQTKCWETK